MGHDPLKHLRIGHQCVFNDGCVFDLQAPITIGNHVALGHQVMLLTCSHVIGPAQRRADYRLFQAPIYIDDGAWLGARCTVLPGVHIGAGAIIAAGALVQRDVAPNTMVGGIPARPIRSLDDEGSANQFGHLQ
ncbi:MAG: acyltransferase [Blastochloris sp.]|nr:acyltransferase [Blastochloris sp.]